MTGHVWSEDEVRAAVRLYLLADVGVVPADLLPAVVQAALRGGCTAVQLRAKGSTTLQQVHLARLIRPLCEAAGVPFIVNDRADVARVAAADGVHVGHLGEEDLSPADARRVVGPRALVGVSVGTADEARRAGEQGANYVSAGPMFATGTKSNAGPAAGLALLRSVRAATRLPLVVIGGITPDEAPSLYAAGADGLCIGSALLRAADPEHVARAFAALGPHSIHSEPEVRP